MITEKLFAEISFLKDQISQKDQTIKAMEYEIKVLRMSLISHGQIVEMNHNLTKKLKDAKNELEKVKKDVEQNHLQETKIKTLLGIINFFFNIMVTKHADLEYYDRFLQMPKPEDKIDRRDYEEFDD